jgi:hypothetical protein
VGIAQLLFTLTGIGGGRLDGMDGRLRQACSGVGGGGVGLSGSRIIRQAAIIGPGKKKAPRVVSAFN